MSERKIYWMARAIVRGKTQVWIVLAPDNEEEALEDAKQSFQWRYGFWPGDESNIEIQRGTLDLE